MPLLDHFHSWIAVSPVVDYKGWEGEEAMPMPTVPVAEGTHRTLQELCQQTGKSVQEIVDKAVEDYRRKAFFMGLDRDYAALKADPKAWAEELEERKLLENTLMDGLDPDEVWTENDKKG
jgi:hypothetical protein